MKTLTLNLGLVVAFLSSSAACGGPEDALQPTSGLSLVLNASPTSTAVSQTPIQEPTDCLPDFVPDEGGCRQAHQVSLTAIAAAYSVLTAYAGAGQQPQIRVYVQPQLLGPTSNIYVRMTNGDFTLTGNLDAPAVDGLGTFYATDLDTRILPQGTYQIRAWLGADATGVPSETLTLVVDRTAPIVTVTMTGLPEDGPAPRDFVATANVNATSHAGFAIADVDVEALGPLAATLPANPPSPWVDFSTTLATEGLPKGVGAAEALIDGNRIPDDEAGLNHEANAVVMRATGTDVLGNIGSAELLILVQ